MKKECSDPVMTTPHEAIHATRLTENGGCGRHSPQYGLPRH